MYCSQKSAPHVLLSQRSAPHIVYCLFSGFVFGCPFPLVCPENCFLKRWGCGRWWAGGLSLYMKKSEYFIALSEVRASCIALSEVRA